MKKIISTNIINMREQDLSNLTKKELIKMLLKQNVQKNNIKRVMY